MACLSKEPKGTNGASRTLRGLPLSRGTVLPRDTRPFLRPPCLPLAPAARLLGASSQHLPSPDTAHGPFMFLSRLGPRRRNSLLQLLHHLLQTHVRSDPSKATRLPRPSSPRPSITVAGKLRQSLLLPCSHLPFAGLPACTALLPGQSWGGPDPFCF